MRSIKVGAPPQPLFLAATKRYIMLTKPGIIIGNLITMAAGFVVASREAIDYNLFLSTLVGLALIIASACVLNNYIDRNLDRKMVRTQHRALAQQTIGAYPAILYAVSLGLIGAFVLIMWTTLLTLAVALSGFAVYVFVYTFLKYRTTYATLIGSVAGAVPPVVGACGASHPFDLGSLILFATILFWQMPHFFAIAIYRFDDYSAASLPVVPVKKGMRAAKIEMLLYIVAFMAASFLLTISGYTDELYAIVTALLGLMWLGLGLKGLRCQDDRAWARQMFQFSLVVVMALCITIPFSLVK